MKTKEAKKTHKLAKQAERAKKGAKKATKKTKKAGKRAGKKAGKKDPQEAKKHRSMPKARPNANSPSEGTDAAGSNVNKLYVAIAVVIVVVIIGALTAANFMAKRPLPSPQQEVTLAESSLDLEWLGRFGVRPDQSYR